MTTCPPIAAFTQGIERASFAPDVFHAFTRPRAGAALDL